MHLLYLTFGENINNHIEAHFSILSFLAEKQLLSSVNVLTDRPSFYKDLAENINVIELNESTLKEWKGEFDFFWRIKIKAIEMMCNKYKGEPIVYLDSDTFLYNNLQQLKEKLLTGNALMHENEGKLSEAKSKTEKKMWSQVGNTIFGSTKIIDTHCMWNAGVVATPNKKDGKDIADALAICDEMCKQNVTQRLIEQYALSVALQEHYELIAADKHFAHYWSNKEEWDIAIKEFLLKASFQTYTIDEMVTHLKAFDFSNIPIKRKVKNTKVRLNKLVDGMFPPKEISFIKKPANGNNAG